jgi:pyridoxine/pyridoxamine 5'-phosphate oxidase
MVMREEKPDDATRARMAQIGAVAVEQHKALSAAVDEAALRRWCVEMAAKFQGGDVATAKDILAFVRGENE